MSETFIRSHLSKCFFNLKLNNKGKGDIAILLNKALQVNYLDLPKFLNEDIIALSDTHHCFKMTVNYVVDLFTECQHQHRCCASVF